MNGRGAPARDRGRINGSAPLADRGRVNGSMGRSNGGRTNGSKGLSNGGRTNGVSLGRPAARPRRGAARRRLAAASALGLLLLASLGAVLVPAGAPVFAVDGRFGEWEGVPAFPGAEPQGGAGPAAPTAVRVAAREQTVFVQATFDRPLFGGAGPEVLRVFVDADADRATGFDMGTVGADLMLEAAGSGGRVEATSLFSFDAERAADDWNGWTARGRAPIEVVGAQMEAHLLPVAEPGRARVLTSVSGPGGDTVASVPAAAEGLVEARAWPLAGAVLDPGAGAVSVLRVSLQAHGAVQEVERLSLAPTGAADFGTVAAIMASSPRGDAAWSATVSPAAAAFHFSPPLALVPGANLTLDVGVAFAARASALVGYSFGVSVSGLDGPNEVVLLPRVLPPSSYLGFVSPEPVVDGAFGEWALTGEQSDAVDTAQAPGRDLLGTRALWSGASGAFFARTRGPVLPGTRLVDLPALAAPLEAPPLASREGPGASGPPAPSEALPPLSADDRLLVFVDADRDPLTGFRPLPGFPVGAEFVVQVSGRFSEVREGRLLAFAGISSSESAWVPRGTLQAVASGDALEGELSPEVAAASQGARLLFQTLDGNGRTADHSEALQEIEARGVDADGLLHFRIATFDPLRGAPPVRPSLLASGPTGYWVVQMHGSATEAATRALEAMGARLYGYVHSNAWIARFDPALADTVRSVPGVRWVGVFEPAYKFASDPGAWDDARIELVLLLFETAPGLTAGVQAAGGVVLSQSEVSARVVVQGSAAQALGFIPEVQFIGRAAQRAPLNDIARLLQGVNLTFDNLGLNGTGIVVGVSDTGIDFKHDAFDDTGSGNDPDFDGRIVGYYRYGSTYGDRHGHGTHTAGSIAGDGDLSSTVNNGTAGAYQFRGVAPAASLVVSAILAQGASPPAEDGVFADQRALGATVSSNSWGYVDGNQVGITDYEAAAFLTDWSVIDSDPSTAGLQPLTIVFAAGNDGEDGANSAGTPGVAKNVITVGASESPRGYSNSSDNASHIAYFSSRGPTDDGRIKPDVVALGTYVLSTESGTNPCTCNFGGWERSWTGANYEFSGGTSMATPIVSGMVALIQQHHNETYSRVPSPALVKAALINGAEDLGYGFEHTGGATGPMLQGWGRANVSRSIQGPPGGTIITFDEGPTVGTGDVSTRQFVVSSLATPLKVTLVWSDLPGSPFDSPSLAELVNDLDLVVRAPNGSYYHGNQFAGAWSRTNNSSFDRLNNVENVFIQSPASGTWTVEVSGHNVRSNPQRFALAVSGNLTSKTVPTLVAPQAFAGMPSGGKFGFNVSAGGSINGDGYTDIAVGAPGAGSGNGQVFVFFGGSGKDGSDLDASSADVVLSGGTGEALGWSVQTSGDFDGDGINDLLIGAPGTGKAYLFYGRSNWSGATANVTFSGAVADRFGESVALVPALDSGPGAEVAVGAPLANASRGRVSIFSGYGASGTWSAATANRTLDGSAAVGHFGASLAHGDFNGDADGDLAIGAPSGSTAHLVLGAPAAGALAVTANFTGLRGTAFGHALALGDVSGDQVDDLIVGAPLANDTAGAVYVFHGSDTPADDQVQTVYVRIHPCG